MKVLLISICLFFVFVTKSVAGKLDLMFTTDRDIYVAGEWVYFSVLQSTLNENQTQFVYISLFNSKNIPVFQGTFLAQGNASGSSIYLTDTLSTGVYQIVAYTSCMRNFGEDSYFRKNILVANRFDSNYSEALKNALPDTTSTVKVIADSVFFNQHTNAILLDKSILNKREKVVFRLNVADSHKLKYVSVTVRQKSPVTFDIFNNKSTHLQNSNCTFLPENKGTYLQGHYYGNNQKPLKRKRLLLSCEDSIPNLQYTETDRNGFFRFYLNPYYMGKKVFVTADSLLTGTIEIQKPFDQLHYNGSFKQIVNGDFENYIEANQKYQGINLSYNQVFRKIYFPSKQLNNYRPVVYTNIPQIVKPEDYVYLPDFTEISRELLPFLKIRKRDNDIVASMFDVNMQTFSTPFIFIDGVLTEHVRQIISLDSKSIKQIETLNNARYLGNLFIPGILNIITTNHNMVEQLKWNSSQTTVTINPVMEYSSYNPGKVSDLPKYIPYFHNLLYWNPSVKAVNSIISDVFYTSDVSGNFEIVISGLDITGSPVFLTREFVVNP